MRIEVKPVKKDNYKQSVRYVNGFTIYFNNKETVYVTNGKDTVLFERWFDKEDGFYRKNWKPFCDALKQRDTFESMYDLYRLALYYGISKVIEPNKRDIPLNIKVHAAKYNKAQRRKNAKRKENHSL